MSIIFKEQNYDQLLSILKAFSIFLIMLLILLTALNYYCSLKINKIKQKIEILKGEELKYKKLLKNSKNEVNKKDKNTRNYNLIWKLAAAADQSYFNSIQLKANTLLLEAESKSHNEIFILTNNLNSIPAISSASLIKINNGLNYKFQIKCLLNF